MARRGGKAAGKNFKITSSLVPNDRHEQPLPPVPQPPPVFPHLKFRPLSVPEGAEAEECQYLLSIRRRMEESLQNTCYYVKQQHEVKPIERYSDRYGRVTTTVADTFMDNSRFPKELITRMIPKKQATKEVTKPIRKAVKLREKDTLIQSKIEALEKKEEEEGKGEDEAVKEDGDEDDEEEKNEEEINELEVVEEDEGEEVTDYNFTYFDNGEGLEDDEDSGDDEAVY